MKLRFHRARQDAEEMVRLEIGRRIFKMTASAEIETFYSSNTLCLLHKTNIFFQRFYNFCLIRFFRLKTN